MFSSPNPDTELHLWENKRNANCKLSFWIRFSTRFQLWICFCVVVECWTDYNVSLFGSQSIRMTRGTWKHIRSNVVFFFGKSKWQRLKLFNCCLENVVHNVYMTKPNGYQEAIHNCPLHLNNENENENKQTK